MPGGWDGLRVDPTHVASLPALLAEARAPAAIDILAAEGPASLGAALGALGSCRRFARAILLDRRPDGETAGQLAGAGYRRTGVGWLFVLFPEPGADIHPPPVEIFAEYHRFGCGLRDAEIEAALADNLALPFVNRLVLVHDEHPPPPCIADHRKCEAVRLDRRMSAQQLFRFADENAQTRCRILINSDIVLDADCFRLPWVLGNTEFFALRRREADGRLNPRAGLDAWCWAGQCRIRGADFELGRMRCDLRLNQLALESYAAGFRCPSLTFTIHHRHASGIRPGTSNLATRRLHRVEGRRRMVPDTLHPFHAAIDCAERPGR
jgi:hypothetical protein